MDNDQTTKRNGPFAFRKRSEPIKEFVTLAEAWDALFLELCKAIGIDRFVYWLNGKIERVTRQRN